MGSAPTFGSRKGGGGGSGNLIGTLTSPFIPYASAIHTLADSFLLIDLINHILYGGTVTGQGITLKPNNADATGKVGLFDPSMAFAAMNVLGEPQLVLGNATVNDPFIAAAGAAISNLVVRTVSPAGGFGPTFSLWGDNEAPHFVSACFKDSSEGPIFFILKGRGGTLSGGPPAPVQGGDLVFQFIGGAALPGGAGIDIGAAGFGYRVGNSFRRPGTDGVFATYIATDCNFAVRTLDGASQEWFNVLNDSLVFIGAEVSRDATPINTAQFWVAPRMDGPSGTALVAEIIQGGASQTGDLTQWRDVSGTVLASMDATGNLLAANGHFTGKLTVDGAIDPTDITYSGQLISTVATGTAPAVVASTTKVTNLNADLLDGLDASAFQAALPLTTLGDILTRDGSSTIRLARGAAQSLLTPISTGALAWLPFVSDTGNSLFFSNDDSGFHIALVNWFDTLTTYLNAHSSVVGFPRIDATGPHWTVESVAYEVAKVKLANQTADISDTILTGVAGFYRVSVYIEDTTADLTAGAVTVHIKYTDASGTARDRTIGPVALTVLTAFTESTLLAELASGNLTYGVTHTGIFGLAKYKVRVITELLDN